jgi:hypothetical protein
MTFDFKTQFKPPTHLESKLEEIEAKIEALESEREALEEQIHDAHPSGHDLMRAIVNNPDAEWSDKDGILYSARIVACSSVVNAWFAPHNQRLSPRSYRVDGILDNFTTQPMWMVQKEHGK